MQTLGNSDMFSAKYQDPHSPLLVRLFMTINHISRFINQSHQPFPFLLTSLPDASSSSPPTLAFD
jgi:hypothetical protein